MQTSLVATLEPLRTVAFGDIGSTYAPLGGPVDHPIRMFRIVNGANTGMFLSLDGETDHFYLPAGSFVLYDLCANRELNGTSFVLCVGTQFYIRYDTDPASGNVVVETVYGRGQ